MTGAVLAVFAACIAVQPSPAAGEFVALSVDVGFTPHGSRDWRVSVDREGRLWGAVEEAKFSTGSLPPDTLAQIRGFARCVTALPTPEFPGPPISDTAESPPALMVLKVRVGAQSREVFIAQGTVVEPGLSNAWPAIQLLLLIRGLVPGRDAYDYRPWLQKLVRRQADPRCPWLTE